MTTNKFCSNCGGQLNDDDVFCKYCGKKNDLLIESENLVDENSLDNNLQQLPSQMNFGNDPTKINYGTSSGNSTTNVIQPNPENNLPQNHIAIIGTIISIAGLLFFLAENPIFQWFSLGFGVIGIILGSIGLTFKDKKKFPPFGLFLGVVLIAVWFSIYFDLF